MITRKGYVVSKRVLYLAIYIAGATALLTCNALAGRNDHDESQYVAGAMLTYQGLTVFSSFASLQPPLQTWLYATLSYILPLDAFIAMRLFTAAFSLMGIFAIYLSQRVLHVRPSVAATSCMLVFSCRPFSMASSLIRNDMVAFALVSLGLMAALLAIKRCENNLLIWALVGLLFGLALSTKLTMAPYGLFCGVFLLSWCRHHLHQRAIVYALGAFVGLIPMIVSAAKSPGSFMWDVFVFGTVAPQDWYSRLGLQARLTPLGKGTDFIAYAADGPMLLALVIAILALINRSLDAPRPVAMLLVFTLVGGLMGAALPTPIQKQYLVGVLPPLFVMLGLILNRMPACSGKQVAAYSLLAVTGLIGLIKPLRAVAGITRGEASALTVDANANWIGDCLRAFGKKGAVATLSADRLAGSGYNVDPRFATGPFLWRSGHLLNASEAGALNVATSENVEAILDISPPSGVLTGYEDKRHGPNIEGPLIGWARRRGYRALTVPDGIGKLYICPNKPYARSGCLSPTTNVLATPLTRRIADAPVTCTGGCHPQGHC